MHPSPFLFFYCASKYVAKRHQVTTWSGEKPTEVSVRHNCHSEVTFVVVLLYFEPIKKILTSFWGVCLNQSCIQKYPIRHELFRHIVCESHQLATIIRIWQFICQFEQRTACAAKFKVTTIYPNKPVDFFLWVFVKPTVLMSNPIVLANDQVFRIIINNSFRKHNVHVFSPWQH